MPALFSTPWADALCQTLNDSAAYREAAAGWEGDIAFVARGDGSAQTVYLDLWRGACRGALAGPEAEARDATFAIEAPLETWHAVLDGTLDPVMGMMLGKLTVRGSLATIAQHAAAAKALVACAAAVETA